MRGMYHTRNSHTICQEQVLKKSIYFKLLNVMCMLYWTNGVKKWNWKQEFVFFMKNKAVHTKLDSVFSKGIVLNKLCIQWDNCNVLVVSTRKGPSFYSYEKRCGCTMFYHVVTSKVLCIVFFSLYYKSAFQFFFIATVSHHW